MVYRRTHRVSRLAVTAAMAALVIGLWPVAAAPARAATPDVVISSTTTVSVAPDRNRVVYVVDAVLTNHIRDTATIRYYVDEAFLGLLPGATSLRATGPSGGAVNAAVTERNADYVVGRVRLGRNVFSGQSYAFRLVYEVPGVGDGAPELTHADESFVSFPVWAHSTSETPGNRVKVILPAHFEVAATFAADCAVDEECTETELPTPTTGANGETIFDFGEVRDADAFWAFFSAKRPGAMNQVEVLTDVNGEPVRVLLRGWADDPAWIEEVRPVLEEGLPTLGDLIGLPYPGLETLYVDETVSWLIAGYAGIYDASTGTIEVSELADDFVTLHEAAHTWFNGSLVVDRWIAEGFADYYAAEAAAELGLDVAGWEAAEPDELAFALIDWPPLNRAEDAAEPYGYNASQWAAALIGERAGNEGLAAVWAAVEAHRVAYQPANGDPELSGTVSSADYRELLDQLEELTDQDYTDIWIAWIVAERDTPELRERAASRDTYTALVGRAEDWNLPAELRDAMDDWRFETADTEMEAATAVLDDREAIEEAATALDLTPTSALQDAFEAGDWETAGIRADAEAAALDSLMAADEALAVEPGIVETVGLIGEDLAADMAAAEAAYEAGELTDAQGSADAVTATRHGAADAGTLRLGVGGGVVVLLGAAGSFVIWRRRRAIPQPGEALASAQEAGAPSSDAASADVRTVTTNAEALEAGPDDTAAAPPDAQPSASTDGAVSKGESPPTA